jgi:hypothetical protein
MTAVWSAIAAQVSAEWAQLNAVWVNSDGLSSVPGLVVMWGVIAAVAAVLVVAWWRRERALRRSVERLRSVLRG